MYIEIVPNRDSPPAILLREGWREGKKTRKRTLASLSGWPTQKIETLRRLLRDEPLVSPEDLFETAKTYLTDTSKLHDDAGRGAAGWSCGRRRLVRGDG